MTLQGALSYDPNAVEDYDDDDDQPSDGDGKQTAISPHFVLIAAAAMMFIAVGIEWQVMLTVMMMMSKMLETKMTRMLTNKTGVHTVTLCCIS